MKILTILSLLLISSPAFSQMIPIDYMAYRYHFEELRSSISGNSDSKISNSDIFKSTEILGKRFRRLHEKIDGETDPEIIERHQKEAIDILARLRINMNLIYSKAKEKETGTLNRIALYIWSGATIVGVAIANQHLPGASTLAAGLLGGTVSAGLAYLPNKRGVVFFEKALKKERTWNQRRVLNKFIKAAKLNELKSSLQSEAEETSFRFVFLTQDMLREQGDACMKLLMGGSL